MKKNALLKRVAIRSNMASGSLLAKFAVEVLGAKNVLADPGLAAYQLADGTILEIHGNISLHPLEIFGKGNTVISFLVDDIEEATGLMLAAGARTLEGIIRLNSAYAYCHLLLDDDQIIGIHQVD